MKKYKFIAIKQVDGELFNDKPVYRIFNNKSNSQLGIVSYYKPWTEYVFSSQPECVFNNGCLRDVLDFIDNHTGHRDKIKTTSISSFPKLKVHGE